MLATDYCQSDILVHFGRPNETCRAVSRMVLEVKDKGHASVSSPNRWAKHCVGQVSPTRCGEVGGGSAGDSVRSVWSARDMFNFIVGFQVPKPQLLSEPHPVAASTGCQDS